MRKFFALRIVTFALLIAPLLCTSCKKDDEGAGAPECPVVMPCTLFGCNVQRLNTWHNMPFVESAIVNGDKSFVVYIYGNDINASVLTKYNPIYIYYTYSGAMVIAAAFYPQSVYDEMCAYLKFKSSRSKAIDTGYIYEMPNGNVYGCMSQYQQAINKNACCLIVAESANDLNDIL